MTRPLSATIESNKYLKIEDTYGNYVVIDRSFDAPSFSVHINCIGKSSDVDVAILDQVSNIFRFFNEMGFGPSGSLSINDLPWPLDSIFILLAQEAEIAGQR